MPGSDFQERMNKQGRDYIDQLRAVVHQLWVKCCEEDGVPLDSKFVEFSPDNKYMQFYNNALQQLWEAEAQYKAGGYVGLTMDRHQKLKTFQRREH